MILNKRNIKITHFNRKPFFFTVQTFPKRKKTNYRTAGVCLYQNTLLCEFDKPKTNGTIWNQNPVTDITTFHCITSQDLNCHRDRVRELTCKLQIKHLCAFFFANYMHLDPINKRRITSLWRLTSFCLHIRRQWLNQFYDKRNTEHRRMEAWSRTF